MLVALKRNRLFRSSEDNWKMVNNPTFAMIAPQAKPDAMTASCFQFQGFVDIKFRKSLKNKDLPPHPFSLFKLRSLKLHQGPDARCPDARRAIRCRVGSSLYGSIFATQDALGAAACAPICAVAQRLQLLGTSPYKSNLGRLVRRDFVWLRLFSRREKRCSAWS